MLIGFVFRDDLIFSSELDDPFVLLLLLLLLLLNKDDSVNVAANDADAVFVLLLLLLLLFGGTKYRDCNGKLRGFRPGIISFL